VNLARDNRLHEPLDELLTHADAGWRPAIEAWRRSPQGEALVRFIESRRKAGAAIYPAEPLRALTLTPLASTRVVILGQDPYHGAGQAEGLAFSVPPGVKLPPSLRNIFKELQRDLGVPPPPNGHLGAWARRGVLLLNAVLTVEEGSAASHAKRGWEALTDSVIDVAARDARPKVFMLWGSHAQAKAPAIEAVGRGHLILQCNHPSPLSATRGEAPFVGCSHFRRASEFLAAHGTPLDWSTA
jgi:uracil-DNA glycosylase